MVGGGCVRVWTGAFQETRGKMDEPGDDHSMIQECVIFCFRSSPEPGVTGHMSRHTICDNKVNDSSPAQP